MRTKLMSVIAIASVALGCHLSAVGPSRERELFSRVKITSSTGDKTIIPLGNGLTIVNLYDDFCSECPTGNRFQTMERLNSLRSGTTQIFVVFSDQHFSTQDVENFKAMLSMPEALVQGDIEALQPYLIRCKLLVVFDSTRSAVWQEKPGMTEQEVLKEVSQLMQTPSN